MTLITITAVYTALCILANICEKIGRKTAANVKALDVDKGRIFRFPNDKELNESDFNIVQMHKQHQAKLNLFVFPISISFFPQNHYS